MRFHSFTRFVFCGAAFLALSAGAQQLTVQQFGVTATNGAGNAVYNLTVTPNAPPSNGALITGTQVLNTDAASHGQFAAVARVPNSVTSALDLIVADQSTHQIVRYPGPGPASYQTSTTIFNFTKLGSGPKKTTGLAADVAGNLYAISSDLPFGFNSALWVLPFNATTGAYGAPVLISAGFGLPQCGSVGDVLVAGSAATPIGTAAPAWNVGDVLVLINDGAANSRVLVYSQAAIQGVLANPGKSLTGPTLTLITPSQLNGNVPAGFDLWPADATHGVSLLITTNKGRVMRFDSGSGAFTADFANGLGQGLLKVKVGTYSTITYAFVAQSTPGSGRIMQFGAPPASGTNTAPLATLSAGVNNPLGLAATSSGSVPVSACIAPSVCDPLGPQLQTQISGSTGNLPPTAPLLEESCIVQSDPRVTVSGAAWSCAGGTLDVATFCPGFPSTVLPGSMCGHSGPTGSAFVVVKITAKTIDQPQNINNTFLQSTVDANVPLPGPLNLNCPQVPVVAWAPRSDLPSIEGTIPEDQGLANTFIDLTGYCDNGGSTHHIASMLAYGLGLNGSSTGLPNGYPGFVQDKFTNLNNTITAASAQINVSTQATLQGYITQAQNYFNSGVSNTDPNAYGCAMNSLASADNYVRANLPSFSGAAPPGNPNPAGDADGRLDNLFFTIDINFLAQPPNAEWPTNNVPPCVTFTASPTTVIAGNAATLAWGPAAPTYPLSYAPDHCTLSATDGTLPTGSQPGNGSLSTGTLNVTGTYSAELMCSSAPGNGNSITGFAQATVNVVALSAIGLSPSSPPAVAAGGSTQLSALGTYSDNTTTNDLTSSATWTSGNTAVATVSAGLVTCSPSSGSGGSTLITATSASVTGSVLVTCLAPTLTAISISPPAATVAAGGTVTLAATGTYSDQYTNDLTASAAWTSASPSVATVSAGVVTCNASAGIGGSASISATSGGVVGSATVTCQAPTLAAIAVAPVNPTVAAGGSVQLTAMGSYSDSYTNDLTATATWVSASPGVATVAAGLVTCNPNAGIGGSALISAASGGVAGATTVTCQAPALTSVNLTPANPSVAAGAALQLKATGSYSDSYTSDLTATATWVSASPVVATVSAGLVTCNPSAGSSGTASISAASGAVAGATTVTCQAPTLAAISVSPVNPAVAAGGKVQLTATATYSDSFTNDLTASANWSSSNANVATVSAGLVTCNAGASTSGTAIISAASAGVSGTTVVTCQVPVLVSITVTPANPSTIGFCGTLQLTATAKYSTGVTQNVTQTATWASSNTSVAKVSAGQVRCQSFHTYKQQGGTATISATIGTVTGSTTVTCKGGD